MNDLTFESLIRKMLFQKIRRFRNQRTKEYIR